VAVADEPPRIERHEAADRFGKEALRAVHRLTEAMDDEDGVPEPVVVRRDGPHRSLDELAALLDDALAEEDEAQKGEAQKGEDGEDERGGDAARRGEHGPR
jgi:hypothetical protein